jgi:ABC-2 type transport system permease protein
MALSPGESLRRPLVERISLYRDAEEPPLQNPLAPAGGLFDLSFVVQWLLPLTIALAAHGVVSADRQQGTWRLIAATTSSPGRVLAARLLWPTTILTGMTLAAGTLAAMRSAPLNGFDGGLRLLAWFALLCVYAVLWALASGTVTARAATTAESLTSVGLLWMLVTWVTPGVVDAVAAGAEPPANRLAAHVAAREIGRESEQRLPAILEDIYVRHPEWRPSAETVAAANTPVPGGPASRDSRRVYAPALAAADVRAPFARELTDRRERIEGRVRRGAVATPALAVQLISDHLAGTASERFVAFERHVAAQEDTWHDFFGPRIMRLQEMSRADLEQVPQVTAFRTRMSAAHLTWPLAGLTLALAIAALALRASFRHVHR